jgi:hypothetical protein
MWVCEQCGAIKPNQYEKCRICSLSSNAAELPRKLPDAADSYTFLPDIVDPPSKPQVGMPRRFSIGTLMILTVFFALLFGVLTMCSVSPTVFIAITLFVLGITACQALLYGGKNPRKASFVGGAVMYGLAVLGMAVVQGIRQGNVMFAIEGILCNLIGAVLVGGGLGYAVGCLVAGVFLVRREPSETEPRASDNVA